MSRYRGPKGRILRRLGPLPGFGENLHQKFRGQIHDQKKIEKKGKKKKDLPYTMRLKEKQKLRYHYGLTEKNLLNYIHKARRKTGPTGEILLNLLEMRLDNIVFRCGYAPTIPAARQLITHGHVFVNGKKHDKPGLQCQVNDLISLKDFQKFPKQRPHSLPEFLSIDSKTFAGQVCKNPPRQSVGLKIQELLVLEFYSRR